jgi:hypothetical protein
VGVRWVITIEAEGGKLPPFEVRVRRWLKRILRAYGLRCVDVREDKRHEGRDRHVGTKARRHEVKDDVPGQMPLF